MRPADSRPVCIPVSPTATHDHREQGANLIVLSQQPVAVGDENATSAVAVASADLGDRVADRAGLIVGSGQQLDLGCLRDRLRKRADFDVAAGVLPLEIYFADSTATALGGRSSCLGRGAKARFTQVGGMRESGGFSCDNTNTRTTISPGRQFLDPPVVEERRRRALVLDEHLGKVGASKQSCIERRGNQ